MTKGATHRPVPPRRKIPRSFKDLTPAKHFNPRTFFQELVWKAWLTPRTGSPRRPVFPRLRHGQVAITWIGHASFLIQFNDLNVLVDPNFANWLFLLKRIKRAGMRIRDLPRIDLVLLTHAHYDHFHKPTLRKLPEPKIGVMPWGVGELARNLGFSRIVELDWWETFTQRDWKVTFTPSQHWGARTLHDHHRGYGGFVLEHQGRKIYHAGDSAYFDGFTGNRQKLSPEIALLPIGMPITRKPSAKSTWGRTKPSRPSRICAQKFSYPCIMGHSNCHLKTWTNRRAGCASWWSNRICSSI